MHEPLQGKGSPQAAGAALMSGMVFFGGTVAAITAPLPSASSIAVADAAKPAPTDTAAAAPAAPPLAAVSSSYPAASQPADQPVTSLPGQLISGSPSPAATGASPIRIVVLAGWAMLSVLALVLVRRRLRQTGRHAEVIPMTLGTYAFRK